MKKITQSAIALSFLGIAIFKGLHKKKRQHEVFTPTFHSYYPEDIPKDFNEWSEHIYRVNSKRKL